MPITSNITIITIGTIHFIIFPISIPPNLLFRLLLLSKTESEGLDFCLFSCLIGVPQLVQKSEPSSNLEPQFEQ